MRDLVTASAAVLAAVLGFSAVSWFLPTTAYPHTYTDYYDHALWYDAPTYLTLASNDRGGTFNFYHYGGGWTAARRDRNLESAAAWTNVANADFSWLYAGEVSDLSESDPCANGFEENTFNWVDIDGAYDPATGGGSIAGEATYCYYTDLIRGPYMKNAMVRYDQDENWYMGTGTPGSTQVDLLSVATHEIGHATGWNPRFQQFSSECPPTTDPIHVMCPVLYVGYAQGRALMTHDVHTFESVY